MMLGGMNPLLPTGNALIRLTNLERPAKVANVPAVTVTIPANPAFVGLLRSACAHVAAIADLTLEEIEDLRIAVSEAVTLLIPHCDQISCDLTPGDHEVIAEVSAVTDSSLSIDRDDFSWVLLSALAKAEPIQEGPNVTITLTKARASQ